MRKALVRFTLVVSLLAGAMAVTATPAQAHWGDWHQSSCRGDVWYLQSHENRVDYWTAAYGYSTVQDHPYSPSGWGVYDRYTQQGWECGFGPPTQYEERQYFCSRYGGCDWHWILRFEEGYIYYRDHGHNAYYAFVEFW